MRADYKEHRGVGAVSLMRGVSVALFVVVLNAVFVVVLTAVFVLHARYLKRHMNERFERIRQNLEADATALVREMIDRPPSTE